jgi:hypothetical protein
MLHLQSSTSARHEAPARTYGAGAGITLAFGDLNNTKVTVCHAIQWQGAMAVAMPSSDHCVSAQD